MIDLKGLFKTGAIAFLMLSCSPAWHLKKAKEKGAEIKTDTVYKEIITKTTVTDTVLQFLNCDMLIRDTLTIETVRWRTKNKIDTVTKTFYQQVECKPDTIRVPVTTTTTVKAGYTNWQLIGTGLIFIIVGALVSRILWK